MMNKIIRWWDNLTSRRVAHADGRSRVPLEAELHKITVEQYWQRHIFMEPRPSKIPCIEGTHIWKDQGIEIDNRYLQGCVNCVKTRWVFQTGLGEWYI